MDWSKLKSAIGTIAPWLAGTLGTPVAGVAVQAICQAFGLSGSTSTPQDALKALAGATPEQLQTLRTADQKHQEFMVSIGYHDIETLAALDAGDRDSARKMQISEHSPWPGVMSAITTAAVLGVLAAKIFIPTFPSDQLVGQLIGALLAGWGSCLAYWVGHSRDGQNAVNMLAQSSPP